MNIQQIDKLLNKLLKPLHLRLGLITLISLMSFPQPKQNYFLLENPPIAGGRSVGLSKYIRSAT